MVRGLGVQKPQTMWASVSGAFNNMSQSQPTRDSDAITRTLASRQVNDIRHMISLTQMIVLTGGAEWKVSAGSADVITPAQFVARPQSYNGSSDIRPIVANDTLLYIPPNRKKVRSLQYQWAQDSWTGTDLSLLASHLFEANSVVDWAYARDPDSICWTVRDDGVALAFTFLTEQQLYAWSRRTTTGGAFESVCAIQEGDETAVYFIVRRTIDGQTKRYVERMHTRVFDTIAEAWFLDSALQYCGRAGDDDLRAVASGGRGGVGAGRRHRARAAHGVGGGAGDVAGRGVAGHGRARSSPMPTSSCSTSTGRTRPARGPGARRSSTT